MYATWRCAAHTSGATTIPAQIGALPRSPRTLPTQLAASTMRVMTTPLQDREMNRSRPPRVPVDDHVRRQPHAGHPVPVAAHERDVEAVLLLHRDRKSTRLNSSHGYISYAVFC